jgi:hypothetical protein
VPRKKSKVEVKSKEDESDDVETSKQRKKKEKIWYVCYNFELDPVRSWLMKLRASSEEDAWELAIKKIKKEGRVDTIKKVYVRCVDD